MIAEEIDAALINSEALYCLRRHQLVSLCKRHGIKPRGKKDRQLADALRACILARQRERAEREPPTPSLPQEQIGDGYSLLYSCVERAESVKSSSSGLGDSTQRSYETDQENVPPRPATSAGSQSGYGSLPLFRPAEDADQSQSSGKWDRSGKLQRHMGSVMRRFRSVLRTPSRESTEQVPEPPHDTSTPAPEPAEDAMDTENVPPPSRTPLAPLPLDGGRPESENAAGDTMYNTVDLSKKPMRTPAKTPHSSRKTKSSFTTHSPVAGRPREMPRANGAVNASPSAALARMQLYDGQPAYPPMPLLNDAQPTYPPMAPPAPPATSGVPASDSAQTVVGHGIALPTYNSGSFDQLHGAGRAGMGVSPFVAPAGHGRSLLR